MVSTSDPIHRLARDRRALLKLVEPDGERHTPKLPLVGSGRQELLLTHTLPQGNLLFVMNPTDQALTVACRLRELFGDKKWYQYRYLWEETDVQSVREDVFIDTLAPHASALLFVTEEPLREKPVNLWNW